MKSFLDEELKNILAFDFKHYGISHEMNEEYGFSSDVSYFSKVFIRQIKNQISETIDNKSKIATVYTQNDIKVKRPIFFSEFEIKVTTEYGYDEDDEDVKPSTGSAGFIPLSPIKLQPDGSLTIVPMINVSAASFLKPYLAERIYFELGHELTHAYSIYNTILQYSDKIKSLIKENHVNSVPVEAIIVMFGDRTMRKYADNRISSKEKSYDGVMQASLKNDINKFMYIISEPEKRAVIGQLKNELDSVNFAGKTTSQCVSTIKRTDAYEFLKDLLDRKNVILMALCNENINYVCPDLLDIIYKETGKRFKRKADAVIYFQKKYDEYRKFFMDHAGKVVAYFVNKSDPEWKEFGNDDTMSWALKLFRDGNQN